MNLASVADLFALVIQPQKPLAAMCYRRIAVASFEQEIQPTVNAGTSASGSSTPSESGSCVAVRIHQTNRLIRAIVVSAAPLCFSFESFCATLRQFHVLINTMYTNLLALAIVY